MVDKVKLILLLVLLVNSNLKAQNLLGSPNGLASLSNISEASVPPATYLTKQGFEGTGYDNSETWSETGDPDEDYTGVVLDGSQSFRVNVSGASAYAHHQFAATADVWGYFMFRAVSTINATKSIAIIVGDDFGGSASVNLNSTGTLSVTHGGVTSGNTVSTMTAGTTYHVWFRYTKGTGSDGFAEVSFSTDGTKPTSGNNYTSLSNGDDTANAFRYRIGIVPTSTLDYIWDKVRLDDVVIGSNPE